MTASLPWLTSCSSVVLVCVLELLSATSSWTKTERQEQHDESLVGPKQNDKNNMMKVCMQETESVMSAPRHPVPWVPRLPRKTTVDVSLCHACHAKWRWTWVLPRLPRKAKVDVRLCHACHAKVRLCHACHVKSRWMSPSATPATQKWRGVTGVTAAPKPGPRAPPSAICPTPATQNDGRCEVVPRLPREIKVDVTKCHACHAEVARRHGRHGGA